MTNSGKRRTKPQGAAESSQDVDVAKIRSALSALPPPPPPQSKAVIIRDPLPDILLARLNGHSDERIATTINDTGAITVTAQYLARIVKKELSTPEGQQIEARAKADHETARRDIAAQVDADDAAELEESGADRPLVNEVELAAAPWPAPDVSGVVISGQFSHPAARMEVLGRDDDPEDELLLQAV